MQDLNYPTTTHIASETGYQTTCISKLHQKVHKMDIKRVLKIKQFESEMQLVVIRLYHNLNFFSAFEMEEDDFEKVRRNSDTLPSVSKF